MANSDKNIVITPNISSTTADPKIVFSGADASTGAQNITLQAYPTNSGTLSFEGSAGQLFSISNTMTGTIYSVNDVSGIPSIEVLDTGLVKLAQYAGNTLIGSGIDNGIGKLQLTGNQTVTGKTVYGPNPTWGQYLQVGGDGREYVDSALYASVVTTNGNLHLDASSGNGLYLNYYDGSTIYFGSGSNSTVGNINSSGSMTLNGDLTVGNGANSANIYMYDADNTTRRIHCNSNQIGFLNSSNGWGAYCDNSGNWYANNLSGTNTGDQTSVSGSAGYLVNFQASNTTNNGQTIANNYIGYISDYSGTVLTSGVTDGALYNQYYSGSWQHQIYGDYRSGQIALRGKNSGTWGSWRRVLDESNYSNFASYGTLSASGRLVTYYHDHYAGNGYGVRFWESDSYKISMGNSSLYLYGTVSDYSIKMNMDDSSTGRGFTWGRLSYAPIASLNSTSGNFQTAGTIYAGGNITAYSDITLKTNITTIENALEKVQAIRGVTYDRIDIEKDRRHTGVIAQEVEAVLPEVVIEDSMGIKTVAYGNMVGLLIEAIKEQQKQIEELKSEVKALRG